MKTMKHKIISVVAGMLLVCLLPVGAQNRSWQSTSPMQQISTHTFEVRAAEAPVVTYKFMPMTSTSLLRAGEESPLLVAEEEENAAHKGSIRRGFITPGDPGEQSDEFPIGEPWILLLFAAALAATTAIRLRRRQPAEGE